MSAFDLIDAKLKQQQKPEPTPIVDAFKRAMDEAAKLEPQKRKPGRPPKGKPCL